MTLPNYPVQNIEENRYAFMSVGKKGIILKVVAFDEIAGGVFNIGFGDYDFTTDSKTFVKMKTDTKTTLPKTIIIENDGTFDFLKGKDFFAIKNARAKENLKKIQLPAR